MGFFCLLFTRYTQIALHFPGLASGFGFFRLFFGFQTHHVGFSACFPLATPRLLFTFLFQLPVLGFFTRFSASKHTSWVFSPVFRLPNTLHGFFRLLFTRCTQIALHFPDLASGFGFFHLFFGFQTHHVGFFACFSASKHTSWVFLLIFHSLHTYASATVTPPYACLRSNSSPSCACLRINNSPCFACLPSNCSP